MLLKLFCKRSSDDKIIPKLKICEIFVQKVHIIFRGFKEKSVHCAEFKLNSNIIQWTVVTYRKVLPRSNKVAYG